MKEKILTLYSNNLEFNLAFLKKFEDAKRINLICSDIFEKRYHEFKNLNLILPKNDIKDEIKDSNYLFIFVHQEIQSYKKFANDAYYTFNTKKLLDMSLDVILRITLISDASTSIQNERMLKKLALRYANLAKKSIINYLVAKNATPLELIDLLLFGIKSLNNGEIIIKKEKRRTFKDRLKSLFKTEEEGSFLSAEEISFMRDFGEYYKISPQKEYSLNIFAQRIKELNELLPNKDLQEA